MVSLIASPEGVVLKRGYPGEEGVSGGFRGGGGNGGSQYKYIFSSHQCTLFYT